MAAQAVDFTVSGQVSRTLFVTDADSSTSGEIRDNNGATRVRANGSSALDDGSRLGIQFEYGVDADVTLRHANVQYTGEFGRITFGQGSEAGDGSAGLTPSVTGIGAGQDGRGAMIKPFFGSLDGGGRTNMIRYDSPDIGPLSAAFSVGNEDSVSGQLALNSDFGGTVFAAKVASHLLKGPTDTTSASASLTLPSGLAVGGAWGRGNDHEGTPAVPDRAVLLKGNKTTIDDGALTAINAVKGTGRTANRDANTRIEQLTTAEREALQKYLDEANRCNSQFFNTKGKSTITGKSTLGMLVGGRDSDCVQAYRPGTPATSVDPSYFQAGVSYTFGDTTVAANWYNSEDFMMKGSEGTALGFGVSHALPKVGATVHAAVQNYEVERPGMKKLDETVFQLGTLVTF